MFGALHTDGAPGIGNVNRFLLHRMVLVVHKPAQYSGGRQKNQPGISRAVTETRPAR
ncbi:hypothetical protein BN137_3329 [Cronobacter condimenti 1330]|uniref:Uncharacterized protein n=1 Tax=Cronobacter condimenti 1330 TaxID=1073999 RepID=K8A2G6_9ENTR|nr:hypothetical protein BN137_3329 [Cronobacter condimenti 1330]